VGGAAAPGVRHGRFCVSALRRPAAARGVHTGGEPLRGTGHRSFAAVPQMGEMIPGAGSRVFGVRDPGSAARYRLRSRRSTQIIGAVLGEPAAKKVMGVMVLKCRKCYLVIAPEDPMITICCGSPSKFERCEITWHARCAPMMVRQYVPETKGGFQLERRA
jgi:hypothetical protein